MAHLDPVVGLQQQAGGEALVLGLGKGAAPEDGVAESVVERAQPRTANIGLTRIAAPLVVLHLRAPPHITSLSNLCMCLKIKCMK